jgi:hypothetical protein
LKIAEVAAKALALGWPGNHQAFAFLVRLASNADTLERYPLVDAVAKGWSGNTPVLAFLQHRAMNDPEPQVRADILRVLAAWQANEDWIMNFLKERIANDSEPKTRAIAFTKLVEPTVRALLKGWALGSLDDEILSYYRESFHHADPIIRESAVATLSLTLSHIHAREHRVPTAIIGLVSDRAANDPEISLRIGALGALASLAAEAPPGTERHRPTIEFRHEDLPFLRYHASNSADPNIRACALLAIAGGWKENSQALSFIQERATKDSAAEVRSMGLRAIAWGWGGDRWGGDRWERTRRYWRTSPTGPTMTRTQPPGRLVA